MLSTVKHFLVSDEGPTATEYAIMLALIVLVSLPAATLLGQKVASIFSALQAGLPDNV